MKTKEILAPAFYGRHDPCTAIDACETNSTQNVQNLFTRLCTAYNTAVARALCDQVYSDLSQELRDMVYGYLLDDDITLVFTWHSGLPPWLYHEGVYYHWTPFNHGLSTENPLFDMPMWRAIMDSPMQKEIIENWYTSKNIVFTSRVFWEYQEPVSRRGLDFLLSCDRFGLGIQPQLLISNITHDMSVPWRLYNNGYSSELEVGCLEALFRLRKSAKVHLRLYFLGSDRFPRVHTIYLDKFLRGVEAPFRRLQKAGYRPRISIRDWHQEGEKLDLQLRTFMAGLEDASTS
jgi:hypothetical protein